ncbi:MAG: MFS transporter [Thermofilaceae archaeon]
MKASAPAVEQDSWRLARLWAAMFFLYAGTGSANPLLPVYMSWRGLADVEIGYLASLAASISLAATLLISYFSDVIGGRSSLQALLCLASASAVAAYTAATGFAHFALLHPLYIALAFSTMSLSAAVAMDYLDQAKRGAGFGAMRTSGAAGWIAGTLAGGYSAQVWGFHASFAFSASFFTISALLYGPGLPRLAARGEGSRKLDLGALRRGDVLSVVAAITVASIANPAYYTFLPLYMTQGLHASKLLASLAFTVTPLAEIPAMILLGSLSDRVGRRKVIAVCLAAYPVRFMLTGLLRNPLLVIAAQLLHGLTFGGLYVVTVAYLTEQMTGAAGVASSIFPVASNVGNMVGGYLLGVLLSTYGFTTMYLAAAAISSLAIPLLYARVRINFK